MKNGFKKCDALFHNTFGDRAFSCQQIKTVNRSRRVIGFNFHSGILQGLCISLALIQQGLTHIEAIYLRQLLNGAIVWTTYWYKPGGELSMSKLVDKVLALAIHLPVNK